MLNPPPKWEPAPLGGGRWLQQRGGSVSGQWGEAKDFNEEGERWETTEGDSIITHTLSIQIGRGRLESGLRLEKVYLTQGGGSISG